MTRPPVAAAILALLALTAACASPAPDGNATPSAATTASPAAIAASPEPCTLPLVHDTYDGFHIGVPSGWHLFTLAGTVVVSQDLAGTEETVVHPALVTAGATPAGLFTRLLNLLQNQLKGSATLTYVIGSADQPAATVTVTSPVGSVSGRARLRILADPTAHGSQQAALIASWAPAARLEADGGVLDQIGACYGTERASLFRLFSDQVFTYAMPPGWTVGVENQDTLELTLGKQASATYIFFQFLQPNTGVTSGKTLAAYELNHLGIHVQVVLASSSGASTPCTAGSCTQDLEEFTASLNGTAVHGIVYASASSSAAGTSGYVRLALADADLWNSLNGGLLRMAGGIQHDFTQDTQEWARLQRQWLRFDQQVQGFDYALNNMDLTRDPITGQNFDTPYQNWDQNGSAGPGYYDDLGHKLQVITPGQ